ncbi:MAG: DedA family protein [Lentisphaerae bacterium]|nr:DedA family protein [Lentisphaerota bacterium]
MTEAIASCLDSLTASAPVWGFVLIFVFMAVESSFIPFPSEVVMIPAGFLAYRSGLTTGIPWLDLLLAIVCGLAGSMAGAYVNYYLAAWLGRPFLHKYGKYFFLKEPALDRAEEVFREYGELATFVCRLLPAIRQLISIPAGLSKMDFWRFSFFTALGAGIWTTVLAFIGWYFAHLAGDMSYLEMIERGKQLIHDNYIYVFIVLAILVAAYLFVHHKIMQRKESAR